MEKITLLPPVEGSLVSVPLGQSRVFIVSGSFEDEASPKDTSSITVAAAGQNPAATIGTDHHSFKAAINLSCPSVVTVKATLNMQKWVENPNRNHKPPLICVRSSIDSNTITITVQDTPLNQLYIFTCRCDDSGERPLVGLQIEAFDQDSTGHPDKLLAAAASDVDGLAEFRFQQSAFTTLPSQRYPNVYFRITQDGNPLTYDLPGLRNAQGVLRNLPPNSPLVVIRVANARGYVVKDAIRAKWLSLGAHTGFLGQPVTDEQPTPGGHGFYNHFKGGSIYWTSHWGACEVHGLIRQKWADLGWEQGFLGFPVTDELDLPGNSGGRYSLFEHGIVTWEHGQNAALAGPHHYERIYADLRAQILSRHFAVGKQGRRNLVSVVNCLPGLVQSNPATDAEKMEADRARWRIQGSGDENPHYTEAHLHIALAIEHSAGNDESGRALEASLTALEPLFAWAEPGAEGTSRLPLRWDAGVPMNRRPETVQFLDGGKGAYSNGLPASSLYHYAFRTPETLTRLLGPTAAALYAAGQSDYAHWIGFRRWELSMDEVNGLVTSYWIIGKLSTSATLTNAVRQQASYLGNYLADHAYILVRPMGGVSWRGAMGILPALEHPFSRALSAVTGANFNLRTNFHGAMVQAGYWPQLEAPIARVNILGALSLPALLLMLGPAAPLLGLGAAGFQAVLANQVLSPGTIANAAGVYQGRDCFDMHEQDEACLALLCSDAPNKAGLYYAVATQQAERANFDSWSVNFHSWIGLTGLDDEDATVRNTFTTWFDLRQAHNELEPDGMGSRTLFAAGVRTLVMNVPAAEEFLVAQLERALAERFRTCYFAPELPVYHDNEWYIEDAASTLDLMAATALAFWHAKRRADAGDPVSTVRFPQPLSPGSFAQWPKAAVPGYCLTEFGAGGIPIEAIQGSPLPAAGLDSYPLFNLPLVPRRATPPPPLWDAADILLFDQKFEVHATDAGDVATDVTLFRGHEIQIDADGDIWAGDRLDGRNGPEGLSRLINDATWPLHTGIDPAANAFCLLGRLNGYFRIGSGLPRTRWVYPEARPLFLRINDGGPGDGDGKFVVRVRVWGPSQGENKKDPSEVYHPINVLVDGGVVRTSDPADLIEVVVAQGVVENNAVEFTLITPDSMTWRKEIIIGYNPMTGGSVTIWTQDNKHEDHNGLYLNELPGATLTFRKEKGLLRGIQTLLVLGGLETALPGSRITFTWQFD